LVIFVYYISMHGTMNVKNPELITFLLVFVLHFFNSVSRYPFGIYLHCP